MAGRDAAPSVGREIGGPVSCTHTVERTSAFSESGSGHRWVSLKKWDVRGGGGG